MKTNENKGLDFFQFHLCFSRTHTRADEILWSSEQKTKGYDKKDSFFHLRPPFIVLSSHPNLVVRGNDSTAKLLNQAS
jgi:hypothetical protein